MYAHMRVYRQKPGQNLPWVLSLRTPIHSVIVIIFPDKISHETWNLPVRLGWLASEL